MAANSNMRVSIIIDAVDKATAVTRGLTSKMKESLASVSVAAARLAPNLAAVGAEASNLGKSVGGFGTALGDDLKKVGIAAGTIGFGFKKLFIDPASQAEQFSLRLKAIYGGDAQKTADSMAYLKKFAMESSFEVKDLTAAFIRLEGVGLKPANGSLLAVSDAVTKFGGDKFALESVVNAIAKMQSVGKITMETIEPLTTIGIPAYQILGKEVGKTSEQITEMMSKGKLGKGAIQALIKALGKDAKGASVEFSKTWAGITSMLSDMWFNFANMVMGSGLFAQLKGELSGFLSTLNQLEKTGELQRMAAELGSTLKDAFSGLVSVGRAAAQAAGVAASVFKYFTVAVGGADNAVRLLTLYMLKSSIAAFYAMSKAAVMFVISLGPIGITIAAITLAVVASVAAFNILYEKWYGFRTMVDDSVQSLKEFLHTIGLIDAPSMTIKQTASVSNGVLAQPVGPLAELPKFGAPQTNGNSNVNGEIVVRIDQDGQAKVKSVKQRGPVNIAPMLGPMGAPL